MYSLFLNIHIMKTGRNWTVCIPCLRTELRHKTLECHHNGRDSVSNHQPHDCLLNRLLRCRSKKTSKLRVTGLCSGNSPGPVNSPHKRLVTRKVFPFDDVIMEKVFSLRWHCLKTVWLRRRLFYRCYYCFMPREGRHFWVNTYNVIMTVLSRHVLGGLCLPALTHWGRRTHLCTSELIINGSDNGLSPGGAKTLSAGLSIIGLRNKLQWNLIRNLHIFILKKFISKCRLGKGGHFVWASVC